MANIIDATVVNQAYDTSGNGGRKLVMLENGNQYVAVKNGTTNSLIYKSTDNWNTPGALIYTLAFNTVDIALETDGTRIFVIFGTGTAIGMRTLDENGINLGGPNVDTGQTTLGNVSLAINEQKTELHATWSSKNSAYPNSFNIRYAKGVIQADGSVTWGAVEQVTTIINANYEATNPSIQVIDNIPVIAYRSKGYGYVNSETVVVSDRHINIARRDKALIGDGRIGVDWSVKSLYSDLGNNREQDFPSAIFAPQSVNGLANGRIWVAWHGTDTTDTTQANIRVSYSDDGGVSWSAMQKLTIGSPRSEFPSITVNKNNEIFIVYTFYDGSIINLKQKKYTVETGWTHKDISSNINSWNPSTLHDLTLDFTEPLFIYKDVTNSKVGFYGEWSTVIPVEVFPKSKDLGNKTSRLGLLDYDIIILEARPTRIVEKINGVVINDITFTESTSTSRTFNPTEAQWKALKYKKQHTLTVEVTDTEGNIVTENYTFRKTLGADSTIEETTQAIVDSTEGIGIHKENLKASIIAKDSKVVIPPNATVDDLATSVSQIQLGKKYASGTVTSSAGNSNFQYAGNTTTVSLASVTVTDLPFKPKKISLYAESGVYRIQVDYSEGKDSYYPKTVKTLQTRETLFSTNSYNIKGDVASANVSSTGFTLPSPNANLTYTWEIYGE